MHRIVVALLLVAITAAAPPVSAERLAVHTYTVADGLAGDQVSAIVQDRQGFLWIGTRTGLSRFDGVSFRSFDTRDGLPHSGVHDIIEDSSGALWFATGRGLVRMRAERDQEGSAFEPAVGIPGGVSALVEDETGALWAASAGALYRREVPGGRSFIAVDVDISWPPDHPRSIDALLAADGGGLWIGTNIGLFRMLPNGAIVHCDVEDGGLFWRVFALTRDSAGRIWVTGRGVTVFAPRPLQNTGSQAVDSVADRLDFSTSTVLPKMPGEARRLDTIYDLTKEKIFDIDEGPDGLIWMASHDGLTILGADGIARHSRRTGLVSDHLTDVLVDDVGNTWIGTEAHGLMRINSTGFTSYTEEDGLVDRQMASVTLGPSGELVAVTLPPDGTIHLHDDGRFLPLEIPLPDLGSIFGGWGLNQVTFFDHEGKLWVPTRKGLFRFPRLDDLRDLPQTRYERRYLPDDEIYRLFEDSRGDIWMGVLGDIRLFRWQRATDTLHHYGAEDGIPYEAGTAFATDLSGAVWIGFYAGGLARWRDDSFKHFDHDDGIPGGMINCLLRDHRDRLWVGGNADGFAVTDDPTAEQPAWHHWTSADGLTSEAIFSLAEDRFGRIYAGSLKGIDRLDPETGQIDHFDTSTGLVNNLVISAITSPNGDLWFATGAGVNRYRPTNNIHHTPPEVFIDRVTIDGADLTVPLRGVDSIPGISLPSRTEVVDIGFAAVALTPGSRLEFEVSVGPGGATWSPTNGRRFVRLAGLAPGQHTISIHARLPNGSVGPAARVELSIATPLWRQWWFLASIVAVISATVWVIQRLRIRRLKELHQVRSRIAADLHNEMGLSLARVAILADVAGRNADNGTTGDTLKEIGGTARDLVDATSDMAWALDPRHDTMAALVARLRRTASDVVEGFDAKFTLVSDPLDGVPMGSETRRHLFLILKEAIRNACRHGRPDNVTLMIERRASRMVITLTDDGVGFDTSEPKDGQGLVSMERRALEMGGTVSIESSPGRGTRIQLEIPLTSRA